MTAKTRPPKIPDAPRNIQKGVPLKNLLNDKAIECLALNLSFVEPRFDVSNFCILANQDLEPLSLMQRALHISKALKQYLPNNYQDAINLLLASLTPEPSYSEEFGLATMFYLPHSFFISEYGLDLAFNNGKDPFDLSMNAMYELTKRFTSEFAIRNFMISRQEQTLERLNSWLTDDSPHVRRLCSEGTRPKLPWGKRLPSIINDPTPTQSILNRLKDDEKLYVRRSVANHLGDIAKDHPDYVFEICQNWLNENPTKEVKWVIRHALRHPAKKQNLKAIEIRQSAKG